MDRRLVRRGMLRIGRERLTLVDQPAFVKVGRRVGFRVRRVDVIHC